MTKRLAVAGLACCAVYALFVRDANVQAKGEESWRPLFDGKSTAGWRAYRAKQVPSGWKVVDGTLVKEGVTGDLISQEQFGDFELHVEWRITRGGNAGIFYRASEEYDHVYWSGPEYQLLDDDNHRDGKSRLTSTGAAYGLYDSPAGSLKPAGEWNETRILAKGGHVEHWLNGKKLLEYELWSPDWEAKVKASKFGAWPSYGRAKQGHLALQGDHEGTLTIRVLRIRELSK
jgi:hypothetical protein